MWGRFSKWRKAAAISSLLWLPLEMKLLKELRENINQPRHTRSGEILTSSCLSIPPLSCSRFKRHLVFFPVIISSSEPLYQLSIHLWPSPQPPDVLELHARKKETGEGGGKPHQNYFQISLAAIKNWSLSFFFDFTEGWGKIFNAHRKVSTQSVKFEENSTSNKQNLLMLKTKICCRQKLYSKVWVLMSDIIML